ncbi:MAG: radical SAM protein, partial [Prolixibacteraceae bacterium]|nr:radical SAM protein [Prolixibacteraceae bacterium]
MKEALFYEILSEKRVICKLCPHNCILSDGHTGICNVRINNMGKLYSSVYSHVAAIHSDPVEKKPLYHFYPGKNILSIGSIG